jgi:predicted XRE-type DNA-binding protein
MDHLPYLPDKAQGAYGSKAQGLSSLLKERRDADEILHRNLGRKATVIEIRKRSRLIKSIEHHRKLTDLKQVHVSARLGFSPSWYNQLVMGRIRRVNPDILFKLLRLVKANPLAVFTDAKMVTNREVTAFLAREAKPKLSRNASVANIKQHFG